MSKHGNRIYRRDIIAIRTALYSIELAENQTFCETDKAFEIWQETNSLNRRIKRYDKARVLFILTNHNDAWLSV